MTEFIKTVCTVTGSVAKRWLLSAIILDIYLLCSRKKCQGNFYTNIEKKQHSNFL